MEKGTLVKGLLGVVALAGAGMFTGCSCAPVREEIVVGDCASPVAVREVVEPVREYCGAESIRITSPCDRYYDPLIQSWERPWPFGPYGTANWR